MPFTSIAFGLTPPKWNPSKLLSPVYMGNTNIPWEWLYSVPLWTMGWSLSLGNETGRFVSEADQWKVSSWLLSDLLYS